jgi:hypothetical protein
MKTKDSYPRTRYILKMLLILFAISILVALCSCSSEPETMFINRKTAEEAIDKEIAGNSSVVTIGVGTIETLQYQEGETGKFSRQGQYSLTVRYCGTDLGAFILNSSYVQPTSYSYDLILESTAVRYPYTGLPGKKEDLFIELDSYVRNSRLRFTLEVLEIQPERIVLRITDVED